MTSGPRGSILIVEDERNIRENLKLLLELEGFRVHEAPDGKSGIETLRQIAPPCLVILDLMMPVMDGWEFLQAKNKETAIADIPVCVVSGVADRPDLQALRIGAFLPK